MMIFPFLIALLICLSVGCIVGWLWRRNERRGIPRTIIVCTDPKLIKAAYEIMKSHQIEDGEGQRHDPFTSKSHKIYPVEELEKEITILDYSNEQVETK